MNLLYEIPAPMKRLDFSAENAIIATEKENIMQSETTEAIDNLHLPGDLSLNWLIDIFVRHLKLPRQEAFTEAHKIVSFCRREDELDKAYFEEERAPASSFNQHLN
jgi:hypothetical protein